MAAVENVAVPDAKKWLHSSFYKEALDNVVSYNAQAMKERRGRLPYVDAQTGIAQADNYNWKKRSDRQRGILPGQVFSYVPNRWRLEPKGKTEVSQAKETKTTDGKAVGVPPSSSGLIQTLEGGVLTKRSSRIASRKEGGEGGSVVGVVMPVGSKVVLESPGSSEHNEEEESPELDMDYLEDYDSDEEKRPHRKKKRPSSGRSRQPPASTRSSRASDHDKPFLCKLCKRRYKTVASLKAHTTQYHGRDISASSSPAPQPIISVTAPAATPPSLSSSTSAAAAVPPIPDEKVPIFLAPPPSLQGKPLAKPNPICDFCLGDNNLNKKTGRTEKLVSCSDCGRSGHPTCMQFSASLSLVVRTYRWQCIECKTCHLCGTSENDVRTPTNQFYIIWRFFLSSGKNA
ncbi:Zinc finger protein DPF3 [Geodia barretti]|uniref:Zinc finger protein DPF3 n=1 Tax=Geodia barretti TaxID=519541 RepID=A0AA35RU87_GEOBA|nr:Zinc finger protein DPF3 [Geodia barretti]